MVAWLLRSLLKMRLNATRLGSIASSRSFGDQLDDLAGQVPSLDLNFAQNKSLIDDYSGTTLVTHTRASSGTYVGSDGVLRTATTNLLLRSEEFDDASWINLATTVTSNAIAAPNGTNTADFLTENSTTNAHNVAINTVVVNGALCTSSVYAKRNGRDLQLLFGSSDVSGNPYVNFDLANGTVASTSGTITGAVQPVGDGWYRCSVTVTSAVDVGFTCVCGLITSTSAGRAESYAGDGTSGIYLWGAQLEQSATVGEYVPTTSTINSAPRFDHNPTTGESLGLLVEEARTNLLVRSEEFDDASWTKASATITANESTAPDGTTTADLWTSTGSTSTVNQSYTKDATARTYSASIWVKSSVTAFSLALDSGSNTNRGKAVFNLATGVLTTIDNIGTFTNTSGTITAYPDSWYRVTVTTTTSTATTVRFIVFFSGTGATARIWGAQLEENAAFATSYIPTVAATATRAADVASITGSNFGVTRTNLLVRSEEFDSASWNSSAGARTITPNSVAAPDGLLTADTVAADGTTAPHFVSQSLTLSAVPYAYSVFAKAGTNNFLQLRLFNAFGGMWANFNLATGVVGTVGVTSGAAPTSSIQAYPNGWYRCTMVFTPTATTSSVSAYIVSSASATGSETNSLSTALYLWGAQVEVGSAVTPYIQSPSVFTSRASSGTYVGGNGLIQTATTNEARYDHDPISLIGKGLLLEEARTNLLLRSEEFQTTWTIIRASISADATNAPNGTLTADRLIDTTDNNTHVVQQSITLADSTNYAFSVFLKADQLSIVRLQITNKAGTACLAYFNLLTGAVSNESNATGLISPFQNGWYRCTILFASATGAAATWQQVSPAKTAGTAFYIGNGTDGLFLWGAQLEAGSFPTSYIPTTTATVTRAADISTSVATSVFESSWYRQDEGTVFANARTQQSATSHILAGVSTGSFASSAYLVKGSNNLLAAAPDAAPSSLNITLQSVSSNVGLRAALAFTAGTGSASATMNGGTVGTDASTGIPITMSQMGIGTAPWSIGTTLWNGHIARLTYWPTRLGNEVLQRITQ
jgi:hypothetical protein